MTSASGVRSRLATRRPSSRIAMPWSVKPSGSSGRSRVIASASRSTEDEAFVNLADVEVPIGEDGKGRSCWMAYGYVLASNRSKVIPAGAACLSKQLESCCNCTMREMRCQTPPPWPFPLAVLPSVRKMVTTSVSVGGGGSTYGSYMYSATLSASFSGTAQAFEDSLQGMGILLLLAIVSVLMIVGFQRVVLAPQDLGPRTTTDSRGEPFP